MKKIKIFILIELIAVILFPIAVIFFDIKLSLSILFIIILICNYSLYKEKIGQELIIALFMGLIITSYYIYEYKSQNILIGRINLFPLISWTAGLVLLREIYEKIRNKHKFLISSLIYIIALFSIEYIGYYIFNIKLNTDFPSLLRLGVIHAPLGMKLFYIFAGPIYLLTTDYLKVK